MIRPDKSMTDEYLGLLAAVIAAPESDLPRLVMADWLDENNECKRAEFIRLQCELTKMLNGDDEPNEDSIPAMNWAWDQFEVRRNTLLEREEVLWGSWPDTDDIRGRFHKQFGEGWMILPAAWGTYDNGGRLARVQRGFVCEIHCTLADWCGGYCWRCNDISKHYPESMQAEMFAACPICHGTGRMLAIGPKIVRENPVLTVWLKDREPAMSRHGWSWYGESSNSNDPARLPDKIWSLLPHVDYQTVGLAYAALSTSAILWAKNEE
jgi:uncharacterized protein (TIGR02996 family)